MNKPVIDVLLIALDPATVLLLQEVLDADLLNTFSLTQVETTGDGLARLGQVGFDIALVDLDTPGGGLDGIAIIRSSAPALPVVGCSLDDIEGGMAAIRAGAQDCILKTPQGFSGAGRIIRYAIEREIHSGMERKDHTDSPTSPRDAAGQKLPQGELSASEEHFSRIFHSNPASQLIVAREDGRILDANEAFCRLSGYRREYLVNYTTRELNLWVHPSEMGRLLMQLRTGNAVPAMEAEFRAFSGEVQTLLVAFEPVTLAGVDCIISTAVDITARRQMEDQLSQQQRELQETIQQLEQSRNTLQTIIESIPVRVFWKDKDLRYLGCNHLFARDAGHQEPQELLGKDDYAMGWKEQADLYRGDDRDVMQSNQPKLNIVEPQTTPGGDIIWLNTSKVPLHDLNGEVGGVLGVYEDITSRKAMEEALRQSDGRARAMLEAIPDLMFRLDRDGIFLDYKADISQLYARDQAPLIGKRNRDVSPPEFADLIDQKIKLTLDTGELQTFEYQLNMPEGVKEYEARMIPSGSNEVLAVVRDITGRNKAEKELRRLEMRNRALIEHAPDGIVMVGANGKFKYVSPSSERLFGYSPEDVLAGDPNELTHPDDLPVVLTALVHLFENPDELITLQYRFRHKNGSWRWIESTFSNLLAEPSLEAIVINFHDITDRREAEEALRASNETAQAILNAATESVFLIDSDGTVIACNETTATRLGKQVSDMVGVSVYDFIPSDVGESRRKQVETVVREGRPVIFEDERFGAWIENSIYPIFDQNGNVHRLAIYGRDITERKKAEYALQQSEQRLREAQNVGRIGDWEMDPATGVTSLSDKMYEILERDPALGAPSLAEILLTFHPGDVAAVQNLIHTALETGEGWEHDDRVILPDGSEVWHHSIGVAIQDADGRVTRLHGVIQDITERKRAEIALRASEEKYRGLMESLDTVVASVDRDGKILYMNDTAANQLGGNRAELIGRRMDELFPGPVADRQMDQVRKAIQQDHALVYEDVMIIQGKPRWFRTSIQPIHDETGHVVYALINSTDIHDLKTTQQKLEELNRTLEERVEQRTAEVQDLYDNSPSGYHSLDANGRFQKINQTELTWLGYSQDEVIGRPFTDFLDAASLGVFQNNFPGFKERGWVKDLEFNLVCKDGRIIPVLINATAIYDKQGNYFMSRSTVVDNTERKAAAEALRATNQELERALRLKDEFLANMSHELRTPLNGILSLSEILLDGYRGPLNEHQARFVQSIDTSGRHLLTLINDLLDISKIEAGKLEIHPEMVVISDVCHASLSFVKEQAKKKGISLSFVPESVVQSLSADQRRLKQILVNLLSNAVKFTSQNGQVVLRVRANLEKECIEFSISDTGIGISQEDIGRLFTPFTQVDSSLSRQYEGTGLGLALVKRLAEMHGGRVSVRSQLGKGSVFTVALPWQPSMEVRLALQDAAKATATERVPANTGALAFTTRGVILLAEDNEITILTIGDFLANAGYQVIIARNGLDVFRKMDEILPDLVLMDIQMPEMDGLEAIRRMRADARFTHIPIVALTALAMPGDREECLAAGANEYVSKPVGLKRLMELVETMLGPG